MQHLNAQQTADFHKIIEFQQKAKLGTVTDEDKRATLIIARRSPLSVRAQAVALVESMLVKEGLA